MVFMFPPPHAPLTIVSARAGDPIVSCSSGGSVDPGFRRYDGDGGQLWSLQLQQAAGIAVE
jgi:hypothetical protein